MKTGRNDPCPCGSGKKYKKCHLAEDERAHVKPPQAAAPSPEARVRAAIASLPPDRPPPERSPEALRWERFWKDYKAAPLDEAVAMARRALAEEPTAHGEMVFDLIESLTRPLQEAGRAHELDALLREVEALHPEAAAEEKGWFEMWRAEDAMLTGADPTAPLLAWAPDAPGLIDMFHRMLERLAFHGRTSDVSRVVAAAWPSIKESHEVMPHAIEEHRTLGAMATTHRHLEERPDLDRLDDALGAELAPYEVRDVAWFETFVRVDRGGIPAPWRREDLATVEAADSLDWLTVDFARALRERWSWPRTRAEQARGELLELLLGRPDDEEPAKPATRNKARRGDRSKPDVQEALAAAIEATVLPSHKAFERAVARCFDFLSLRTWQGTALFSALPAWCTFVTERSLAAPETARARRASLGALLPMVVELFERAEYDPAAKAEMERAWATG